MDVLEPWGCLQMSRLWVFPDVFGLSGCMRNSDLRGAGYRGKEGRRQQHVHTRRAAATQAACRPCADAAFRHSPTSGARPLAERRADAGAGRGARPGLPVRRRTGQPGRLPGPHAWPGCACRRCCHRPAPMLLRTGVPRNAAPVPPRPPNRRRRHRRDSLRVLRPHLRRAGSGPSARAGPAIARPVPVLFPAGLGFLFIPEFTHDPAC